MYLYASDASVSWHAGVNRPRPRHPPVSDLEHHSHALARWHSCLCAALGMLQVFSFFHIKESVLSFRIVSCQISLKLPPTSFNSFLRGRKVTTSRWNTLDPGTAAVGTFGPVQQRTVCTHTVDIHDTRHCVCFLCLSLLVGGPRSVH